MSYATVTLATLACIAAIAATPKAKTEAPVLPTPLAIKVTTEEGYRIEEGFLRATIKSRLVLLQGLVVKKADAAGKLPIMIVTHGSYVELDIRSIIWSRILCWQLRLPG